MYLTRFRVNTARRDARRLLSSPQSTHAAVMASFPGAVPSRPPDGQGPRVLWRLDHRATAEVHLYIVGPERPDLTHLVEQAGWPTAERGWETFPYAPFLDRIAAGDHWAFRLTANPVHHTRRHPGEPAKRTAHITARHQIGWLLQRQQSSGFAVLRKPAEQRRLETGDEYRLEVHDRRGLEFAKRDHKAPVTLATATFDGHLTVTDAELFRGTLTRGLGKAKAYGCGLMTLGPVA